MNSINLPLNKGYGMSLLTLLFLMVSSGVALSQQLKTTYYDVYTQTKPQYKYYVNSAGEKHGSFTGYSENGVVALTCNFKNGKVDGVSREYYYFGGVQTPKWVETYVDGVLEGSAKYYNADGVIRQEGIFKNGKKEGKWTFRKEYINYDLTKEEKKGNEYYTFSEYYTNDDASPREGLFKTYFYPSGKPYQETQYLTPRSIGDETVYFPNGNVASERKKEDNKFYEKTYWFNGQLKSAVYFENGYQTKYESYEKDGSPSQDMLKYAAEKEANLKKVEAQNLALLYIDSAAKAINAGNVNKAIQYYTAGNLSSKFIKRFDELWNDYQSKKIPQKGLDGFDELYKQLKWDYTFDDETGTPVAQLHYADEVIRIFNETQNKIKEMETLVNTKVNQFKTVFTETKNTFFVDQNNNPITKETYPKGEYIYKKSLSILQGYLDDYNNEKDTNAKLDKGLTVMEKFDAMIKLSETDTEELNKKMKKIEDQNEIITLLGL